MSSITIFQCEDSVDGIFTAVYDAWDSKLGHNNVKLEVDSPNSNLILFAEYKTVITDYNKSEKVARTIKSRISDEFFDYIYCACLSNGDNKADSVYRCIILGLKFGSNVMQNLSNPSIYDVFTLHRYVGHESHKMLGFLRFSQINNNILFAKLDTVNDIITLLCPHFSDRLKNENWIIFDERRKKVAVHTKLSNWYIQTLDNDMIASLEAISASTNEEKDIINLWKIFLSSVAISERYNPRCQRNLLPLHYRHTMCEFQHFDDDNKPNTSSTDNTVIHIANI